MPATSHIGLQTPPRGSNLWDTPLNYNFSQIDLFLSGLLGIPGLLVNGDVTVLGSITAGSFIGLSGGTFLTSADYDVPNGIAQLDGTGKIPANLLPGTSSTITVVPYSATPTFAGSLGSSFKMTLTGPVNSSTYAPGASSPSIVVFRIVQDATGGRPFTWPANVRDGGTVNPAPNAVSIQAFAPDVDGSLDSLGPMMYS